VTPEEARASIDRRVAVAVLAGATVGPLPLIWLIREALDGYAAVSVMHGATEPPKIRLVEVWGGHDMWLVAPNWNGSKILVEHDHFGSTIRSHEVPNAALVLHDVVKGDPVSAEALLVAIEAATEGQRR
jgi:hypothetical protein